MHYLENMLTIYVAICNQIPKCMSFHISNETLWQTLRSKTVIDQCGLKLPTGVISELRNDQTHVCENHLSPKLLHVNRRLANDTN